jgi:hypothetical protein
MSALACTGGVWDELTSMGVGLWRNGGSFHRDADLYVSNAPEIGGYVEMAVPVEITDGQRACSKRLSLEISPLFSHTIC